MSEEDAANDESESPADTSQNDERLGDLDRAHLREKNHLLTGKVERLESELKEKSERIEELKAQVDQLRTELATTRSERDRLVDALKEREFYQEMNDEQKRGGGDGRSSIEKVRQLVSFDR